MSAPVSPSLRRRRCARRDPHDRYAFRNSPPNANCKEPASYDLKRYKDRYRIERMFNMLQQDRRIATRYDKTLLSFIGVLCLAVSKLWMPAFVNRA
jgi:transposase